VLSRTLLIVEDDNLLRELLASACESRGFIVQTASTAADAKRAFSLLDFDGVVTDVELGRGLSGFDLAESLLKESPETGVIFLTRLPDSRFAEYDPDGLPNGIAYLRKSALADLELLFAAIDAVLRGRAGVDFRHDQDANRPFAKLTAKQIRVLRLMSRGFSNAQIAEARGSSIKATEDTVRRACLAVGVDPQLLGNARTTAVSKFLSTSGISADD